MGEIADEDTRRRGLVKRDTFQGRDYVTRLGGGACRRVIKAENVVAGPGMDRLVEDERGSSTNLIACCFTLGDFRY